MDTPGRVTEVDVGTRPCYPGYEVFVFNFHRFASLPTRRGYSVTTSKVTFFGHEWWLELFPGGDPRAENGMMSVFLRKTPKNDNEGNKGISLKIGINVRGFNGAINLATNYWSKNNTHFNNEINSFGWINYMKYADIRNPSNNFLSNGTLSIMLELKFKRKNSQPPPTPVVLPNSCNSKMLALWHQDVKYMDVSFVFPDENKNGTGYEPPKCDEKINSNEGDDNKDDPKGNSQGNSQLADNEEKEEPNCNDQSENDSNKGQLKDDHKIDERGNKSGGYGNEQQPKLYAHRAILQACAPYLFELCEFFGRNVPVPITNVKSRVFSLLLGYIYGLAIPPMDWRQYSREILNAADCYGVSGLKLEAEVYYVKHTLITEDNAIDLLTYAEAINCALLKESVMDFFVKNRRKALKLLAKNDIPGSQNLMADLLVAMNTGEDDSEDDTDSEEYALMRVTSLRRKLSRLGLDIDGSRETLVKRLEEWKVNFGGGDTDYDRDKQGVSEAAVQPRNNNGRYRLTFDSSDDSSSSDASSTS